jgi:ComF family protein
MSNLLSKTREFVLDLLFPKFCLNCGREEDFLCQVCLSLIDVLERQYCPFCLPPKIVLDGKTCPSCRKSKNLNGLYFAASYDNFILKKAIHQFKYGLTKDLAKPLADLIIRHFNNLTALPRFNEFNLVAVPLHGKKLKERGFNQSEELAKGLSQHLKLPVFDNALIKIKQTRSQTELKKEERGKNIQGAFLCPCPDFVKNKRILLVDDVFTSGATMEECAKVLKNTGAKEVWGVAVARG